MMAILIQALCAAGLSAAVIWLRLRFVRSGLDLPGERSLHQRPTPHGGGLGIVVVTLAGGSFLAVSPLWLTGVAVLAALSWLDDWRPLPFWMRLPVHLLLAASVVFLHDDVHVAVALAGVLLIAWGINAYNFMDGADGLAGTMGLTGFSAYALAFAAAGQAQMSGLAVLIAAACAGFLLFNWHPARIFMGDVGSIPLGFLAAGMGWWGVVEGGLPAWFPVLVFLPFLLDASLTLLRRVVRRERFWLPHREHAYQRMVRMGMSHARMCRQWGVWMGLGALLALGLLRVPGWLGWVGAAGGLALSWYWLATIDQRWKAWQK